MQHTNTLILIQMHYLVGNWFIFLTQGVKFKKGNLLQKLKSRSLKVFFFSSKYTVRMPFPHLLAVDVAMLSTLANKMSVEMIHASPE